MRLIIFTNRDYYKLSKTILSPIVHDNNSIGSHSNKSETYSYFQRTDWGFVCLALEAGISVTFRIPTQNEIDAYEKRLENIRGQLMNETAIDVRGDFPTFTINEGDPGLSIKEGLGAVFDRIKRILE